MILWDQQLQGFVSTTPGSKGAAYLQTIRLGLGFFGFSEALTNPNIPGTPP